MDDRFLKDQRREPDPAFARGLRARLRTIEAEEPPRRAARPLPWLAAAAALAVVVGLFVSPGMRLQAQALLDLFRVRDFAVVQVDESRMQTLRERKFDPTTLLGGASAMHTEGDGPMQVFTTLPAAAAAAGFAPERPELLPRGLAADTVLVHGAMNTRGTIDTKPLRELMQVFDVNDIAVPSGLDGRELSIRVAPTMVQMFRDKGHLHAALMQCESPEVSLPQGADLARLGEIGLRIMGIAPAEAHRLAGAIDWRSTLLVPVLASASSFQEVQVRGERGLYLQTEGTAGAEGPHHGPGSVVMWTRAGRVYSLAGNLDRVSLLQMAESVR